MSCLPPHRLYIALSNPAQAATLSSETVVATTSTPLTSPGSSGRPLTATLLSPGGGATLGGQAHPHKRQQRPSSVPPGMGRPQPEGNGDAKGMLHPGRPFLMASPLAHGGRRPAPKPASARTRVPGTMVSTRGGDTASKRPSTAVASSLVSAYGAKPRSPHGGGGGATASAARPSQPHPRSPGAVKAMAKGGDDDNEYSFDDLVHGPPPKIDPEEELPIPKVGSEGV